MVDLGTLVSVANRVLKLLQSPILRDMKQVKSNLENLNETLLDINSILLDADKNPDLSHREKRWFQQLKDVIYAADNIFDEVLTIVNQKQQNNQGANLSNKVLNKVNRFFTSQNGFFRTYRTCQEVKSIQLKLDAIAKNHDRYKLKFVNTQGTSDPKVDTCSFLNDPVFGRQNDVEAIVDMILLPKENVGFVAIVGVGGLGKTTVARMVCDHRRVDSKFDKKIWVCVSDQDGKQFDVNIILGKILKSCSPDRNHDDISSLQSLFKKLRDELENKVVLLILDDLWTEDPLKWDELRQYLTIVGRGSQVVVTTRSEKTAEVVLGKHTNSAKYLLRGLSDEDSWRLFESKAFDTDSDQKNDPELVRIGQNIVKKCSNLPLAVKMVGRLLYGQTDKWESFEKKRLPDIEAAKNPIMSILKLSYDHLEPALKDCFSYLALFPKDHKINKQELIGLWMAQGYTDDGEECFSVLLKRCFFQEMTFDDYGDIFSFKMHDLLHDLAQEVAGDGILAANCPTNKLGKTIHHLFLGGGKCTEKSFSKSNIRSCYMDNVQITSTLVKTLVSNWSRLRTLRLCVNDSESLPESIGKLIHLRYLDLSHSLELQRLPNSITKLYNLQTLILRETGLREWPKNFCKLVNLRMLNIEGCLELTYMPSGIGQLTNLCVLTNFQVCGVGSSAKQSAGLEDLKSLTNLTGCLTITVGENLTASEKDTSEEGSCLVHTQNLKVLRIDIPDKSSELPSTPNYEDIAGKEAVLAKLKPHRNLKHLLLLSYSGARIPRWGRVEDDWGTILPNLVEIELIDCHWLNGLPILSNLKHLKTLYLEGLNNIEYMENLRVCSVTSSFFPSLEVLTIIDCEKLKEWWRGVRGGDSSSSLPAFLRLHTLNIHGCTNIISIPASPSLESLAVTKTNKSFRIIPGEDIGNSDVKLKVEVDSVGYLTTLPVSCLSDIWIVNDCKIKSLAEMEDVLKSCCSSLRKLAILNCPYLTGFSKGLEHLTALESLELSSIPRMDDRELPWKLLNNSLLSLRLTSIDNMETLPQGIKYLTRLQSLRITFCHELISLPEWISCLSSLHILEISCCDNMKSLPRAIQNLPSLHTLRIVYCPSLYDSCQKPSGQDWPKIRHIPTIFIGDEVFVKCYDIPLGLLDEYN